MINHVVLIGRLTKDIELRKTNKNTPVASYTLAVERSYNSLTGEKQADYISCVAWNKLAEIVCQYCSKGSLIGMEGRIETRNYEGSDGKRNYVTEVICENIQFLDNKKTKESKLLEPVNENTEVVFDNYLGLDEID